MLTESSKSRFLIIFPTKALANDQLLTLSYALSLLVDNTDTDTDTITAMPLRAACYDGDLPADYRDNVRRTSSIILTNPDMLHCSILPQHTQWSEFFRNLKLVIIDEAHYYKGNI